MLTFNLKKEWFDKIKSGEKKIEYREYKPYWITRISNYFDITFDDVDLVMLEPKKVTQQICFRCGYNGEILQAMVKSIRITSGLFSDLAIDKPVFAIEFELLKNKGE